MTGAGRDRSAVLFDVDGTLVDSNYQHVQAWEEAFVAVGHPVPAWRIHRAIGMDSTRLLEDLLGDAARQVGESAKTEHARVYAETSRLLKPLPGARELIRALVERKVAVVLATSASPEELKVLRGVLDVDELITAVTSAEDVATAKPEPDLIHVAVQRSGARPERAIVVGDSIWDMQAAARAAIGRIGVLSGGIGAGELRAAGAQMTYDDPAELLADLLASPLARLL